MIENEIAWEMQEANTLTEKGPRQEVIRMKRADFLLASKNFTTGKILTKQLTATHALKVSPPDGNLRKDPRKSITHLNHGKS